MSLRIRPSHLAVFAALSGAALAAPALGWDAAGHRAITWLALDGLDPAAPAYLKDEARRHATGWQAAEADRWRNIKAPLYLAHENNPDHYIDVEDLVPFGLTLATVPKLRYQYVAVMAVQRHEHPKGPDGKSQPYNPKLDPAGQQEWPGFLPHAIVEQHAKLVSTFKTLRTLEKLADPARAPQLEMTRTNVMTLMGTLAHFVGDAAQPLHTTTHHHGWVGDNPHGYTVDRGFHSYIDGTILNIHGLNYHTLKPGQTYTREVGGTDPWEAVIAHIERSYDKVVPLYELKKSGELTRDEGKAFIAERLHDAAATLAALYNSAWKLSEPTEQEVKDFLRYDGFKPSELPPPAPATVPAAKPPADSR
ncbi:MAG: hypothetical protein ACT4PL_08310 [Phycisphaerales bacterium]